MAKKTSLFNGASLVCGIAAVGCFLISRMLSGSPLDMIHKLEALNVLPPVWLFDLLMLSWYFMIGAALGIVLAGINNGCLCGRNEIKAYRGIAFFLIAFFCGLIWYPAFFAGQALFISLLISILTSVCAVCCAYNWFGADQNGAGVIMSGYAIWSIYILIINLSVGFGI